jgi:anti-sigma B factor antagonist
VLVRKREWDPAALDLGGTCQREVSQVVRMIPRLRQRVSLAEVTATERDGVIVVSLHGELDVVSVPVLQAFLSEIRWPEQARCVVDLAGLAFIDCACLGVLIGHCEEIRARGGSFALAGPHGSVLRILSVTGLLTWFDVPGGPGTTPGQVISWPRL